MKDRPILFSAPMVRAILDGSKTQTRRVVKLPVEPDPDFTGGWKIIHKAVTLAIGFYERTLGRTDPRDPVICPYGQPGDRLWVREAFAFTDAHMSSYEGSIEYRADNKCLAIDFGQELIDVPHGCDPRPFAGPWKPSIHMPRWASRILLEVASVRLERLQDISEADADAEGCERLDSERYQADWKLCDTCGGTRLHRALGPNGGVIEDVDCLDCDTYAKRFKHLWQSINGAASWDANPWVWVVSFKRVTP